MKIDPAPIVGKSEQLSTEDKMLLTVFDELRRKLGITMVASAALDKQNVIRIRVTVLGHTITDDVSALALLKDPQISPHHVLGCETARVLIDALRQAFTPTGEGKVEGHG